SPVVEENTPSDAYSIDDESSGDDFVDGNGKGIEVGNRVAKRGSRSNVSHSSGKCNWVMESNSGAVKKRKKSDIIGVAKEKAQKLAHQSQKRKREKVVHFKVDGIPSKLGFYVANNFNVDTMEIKLKDMSIVITHQLIGEMLGIKNEGVDIMTKMLYVDGTVCNEFNVGRKRPPTSFWTMELLKEKEYEEINAGGIGKGELQGPFVKEDDPMPEDEDILIIINNIYNKRKERDGFERTFVVASNVLRGNQFIADVYQQYRASLHYKNVSNKGNSCSDLNVDNNDEPQQVNTLPKVMHNNSKDYDSPAFALGLVTQKEVFTRVDKVVEEFKSPKKGNDFEAPNFSFGVTQDFDMVLSLETPVTDTNTHVLRSANQLEPINAVPMSMCKSVLKDKDVVHNRGKRKYTKLQAARSPFISRVTDINATKVEVTREDFDWQTDKRPNDSGVFFMRHMEAYMGTIISKWACRLETEGRKQDMMLAHLRKRYAATLLLSKCNMHSDSVRAQLDGIQVAEVPVKRIKLPTVAID
nr:C2 calcium-dependent membrane targeting [Tanacetum cinerariifolium]